MNTSLSFTQFRFSLDRKGAITLCLALCTLGLGFSASAGEPDVKTFNAPGAGKNGATQQGTVGIGINFWGAIAGITRDKNDVRHGFVRAPDGNFTIFNHPGAGKGAGQGTKVLGLNAQGAVVGLYTDSNDMDHPYIRNPDGTFTAIDIPHLLGGNAYGINLAGTVVGNYLDLRDYQVNGYHAYVRSSGGVITKFDPTGSVNTDIQNSAINDFGVITGDYWVCVADFSSCTIHGFVRASNGTITAFDVTDAGTDGLSGQGTFPQGINDAGQVAGYYVDGNDVYHSFVRDSNGSITTFDVPGACTAVPPPADCAYNGTAASSINLWGTVAGYFSGEDGALHGFWRAANGSISTFDALGAGSATLPTSINFWGQITGIAVDASGVYHGLLLKP
jgi:hypothetical protein